ITNHTTVYRTTDFCSSKISEHNIPTQRNTQTYTKTNLLQSLLVPINGIEPLFMDFQSNALPLSYTGLLRIYNQLYLFSPKNLIFYHIFISRHLPTLNCIFAFLKK